MRWVAIHLLPAQKKNPEAQLQRGSIAAICKQSAHVLITRGIPKTYVNMSWITARVRKSNEERVGFFNSLPLVYCTSVNHKTRTLPDSLPTFSWLHILASLKDFFMRPYLSHQEGSENRAVVCYRVWWRVIIIILLAAGLGWATELED